MGVDAPSPPGTIPRPAPEPSRKRRWRNRAPLLVVLALTLIGVGAAVFGEFLPKTEEPLDKRSQAAVAQACDSAYRSLKALPPLTRNTTRAELAARLVQENGVFEAMVEKFAPLDPPD